MNSTTNHADLVAAIMYHPKDWDVLRWCIWGLTRKLKCSKIYVVGRASEHKRVSRLDPSVNYIDEDEVVSGLTARSFANERWGWFFQQILKLSLANLVSEPYYLVVDADTVFLRLVKFFDGEKALYAAGSEYNPPYFRMFKQLLGFQADREFSFISHHMVFCSAIVKEMLGKFNCEVPWWTPIVECMLKGGEVSFSEYETYGHYIKAVHPESFRMRPLRWRNMPGRPTRLKLQALALRYHYCSFHSYARDRSDVALLGRLIGKLYSAAVS